MTDVPAIVPAAPAAGSTPSSPASPSSPSASPPLAPPDGVLRQPQDLGAPSFEATLPADFALPENVQVTFSDKDPVSGPVLQEARALAHELNIGQAGFSKLLALQTKLDLARLSAEEAATEAEQAKIKDFPARQEALLGALNKSLSVAEISALRPFVVSGAAFTALERLAGLAPPPPAGLPTLRPVHQAKSHADRIWPGGFATKPAPSSPWK